MRCTDPRTVGFLPDGKTLTWSSKNYSKEYATFPLPCGKCIECRLEYARTWAIRCVHEAQMHPDNSFLTLTYNEECLKSNQLNYDDVKTFVKALRDDITSTLIKRIGITQKQYRALPKAQKQELNHGLQIGYLATGEYGELKKRPHWHIIMFNWRPHDCVHKYTNDRGDRVYSSHLLSTLWPHGNAELGSVTMESAGYVARYSAKKLVHGPDSSHPFEPISKKSNKQAIGKAWLEKYWDTDCFNHGHLVLPNGQTCSIPRYYEKWLMKHKPERWVTYVTQTKQEKIRLSSEKAATATRLEQANNEIRLDRGKPLQVTKNETRKKIQQQKFKQLQEHLKLK